MVYVHNIDIISGDLRSLEKTLADLGAAETMGLQMNHSFLDKKHLGTTSFYHVKDFIYLGTQVTSHCKLFNFSSLFECTFWSELYNTLIVQVLVYGDEVWALTQSDKKIMDSFDIEVLKGFYRNSYISVQNEEHAVRITRWDVLKQYSKETVRNVEYRTARGTSKVRWKDNVVENHRKLDGLIH